MTPVASLPGIVKLASLVGGAVKHVASKVNFANALRQVGQVGGHAPGAPRLVRLDSHEEGRLALTLKSGVDPSLEQRRNSLDSRERVVSHRRSSQQGARASGPPSPPDHAEMVVQKATVLAKDYLRARGMDASPGWVQKSQRVAAPSQGKDVERHTVKVLRGLQDELANTAVLFDGTARGDAARRIGAAVARVRKECGPEEALRIASQGIEAVRSASARFDVKNIEPPRDHLIPANSPLHGTRDSDRHQASPRSSSLPSVGSDSVFDDHDTAVGTASSDSKADDPLIARGSHKSLTDVDYIRKLRTIQKELFRIASKYPGTERGSTARDLHSATQRVFEVVDAKTAYSGASSLLPVIRTMSTSQAFG